MNTHRNTPSIQNVIEKEEFFWDGRAKTLNDLIMQPIHNSVEMGMHTIPDLCEKLNKIDYYLDFAEEINGTREITQNIIKDALNSFMSELQVRVTHFDLSKNDPTGLNEIEKFGKTLFETKYKCGSCHSSEPGTGYVTFPSGGSSQPLAFTNIGLVENGGDRGLFDITKNPADIMSFKIPDLRNVSLTGPYMHDGRFQTLDQVLDHYSIGIGNSSNLDPRLVDPSTNQAKKFNFSQAEKIALIAFLKTLSSTELQEEKFSNPFYYE
jgi:cytochrome c peroxidase